ncbi:MAG: endonuclease [Catenulispora sp.]|nr:endonuclease [Catenulispora sp.]
MRTRTRISTLVLAALALTCGALTSPIAQASAATATTGSFSVLSYNVAGLPQGVSSAPGDRTADTTMIGQRLGPFDVVHVEEDFNYHAALYAGDTTHAYRTPTSGGAGLGSGLNTLSDLPYAVDDFERVKWNACQLDSGDCLTPKGFTFMKVRIADGVYVDFYNLHTNAGTNDGDEAARASNLSQLSAYIQSHSAGDAVIVMGDTNTRYTRAADTIAQFASANGLTDVWVRNVLGGAAPAAGSPPLLCDENAITDSCEVVDKVLYRGSKLVDLNATSYHNEHAGFLDASGQMLSDHDPISARFTWTLSDDYRTSEQYGGPHGDYFNDLPSVAPRAQAATIRLRSGSRVDQVGLSRTDGTTAAHGGTGGTLSSLTLGPSEHLTTAILCEGSYNGHTRIFSAKFGTDLGRSLSGGTTTSDCVTYAAPAGWQIAGFQGRAGDEIDKLGLVFTRV